jgi:hypothetical protein
MNPTTEVRQPSYEEIIVGGAVRGLLVDTFNQPLEVVKLRQQMSQEPSGAYSVAKKIFREEGLRGFGAGFTPQIMRTFLKQCWVWPMITRMPPFFASYGFETSQQQLLTGLSIATVDACINPLEKARIVSAVGMKKRFSFADLKNGWNGMSTYWAKRSVSMVTFMLTQDCLRNRKRKDEEELSLPQLFIVGAQVAFTVGVVSAPFDALNTLKQVQTDRSKSIFRGVTVRRMFRGGPIGYVMLLAHNIGSVVFIELLTK